MREPSDEQAPFPHGASRARPEPRRERSTTAARVCGPAGLEQELAVTGRPSRRTTPAQARNPMRRGRSWSCPRSSGTSLRLPAYYAGERSSARRRPRAVSCGTPSARIQPDSASLQPATSSCTRRTRRGAPSLRVCRLASVRSVRSRLRTTRRGTTCSRRGGQRAAAVAAGGRSCRRSTRDPLQGVALGLQWETRGLIGSQWRGSCRGGREDRGRADGRER